VSAEALPRDRFATQAVAARELLDHPSPVCVLRIWLVDLGRASAQYRGLSESMATALSDETPQLYVSCHAMLEARPQPVDRARWIGELRADVTSRELLLLCMLSPGRVTTWNPMAASIGFSILFSAGCAQVNTVACTRGGDGLNCRSSGHNVVRR
jgi:hypothetical protein